LKNESAMPVCRHCGHVFCLLFIFSGHQYKKIGKVRKPENGIKDHNMLIHRMYGAVNIDDVTRLVKVTMQEHRDKEGHAYDYRVTKIDLPISGSSTTNALGKPIISVANLLNNVEKSYDPGKLILAESAKLANNGEETDNRGNGVEFVGESRSTSRPVPQYIKKYFGSTTGDEFSNQEKDTILEGYNHIKAQNPHAIAMIKTPKGYVLINEDRRMLSKDLGTTFAPFVLIKPNDVDLVRSAVVSAGKMIGIVDINDNAWRKAAVRPMPQPKTSAAPEGRPLSNTGTAQTEKDPGVYGWADRRRSSYWNDKPEFKSISDAAWWCYDLIGNVRSASESKEYTGKDYSRLLSMDDSHGEQVDVEKAKKHAGMVIPMAEMMKKHRKP